MFTKIDQYIVQAVTFLLINNETLLGIVGIMPFNRDTIITRFTPKSFLDFLRYPEELLNAIIKKKNDTTNCSLNYKLDLYLFI